MNAFTAVAIINLGIIILTGFIFYITDSRWSLLILIFMTSTKDN